MGLIVLLAVGAVLGWLASIVTRSDDARAIVLHVIVGIAGALLFGSLVSSESLLVGISATTLLAAAVGASVLLAILAFARLRLAR
ncbi:hypothetical protein A6F68_00324 [Tsuneonella dongtanensis]|uniref:Transglycosylase associated protein n=1 Tax=Tsuneonella dongtanensis TaxID=692370 RepID=A0A1B2A9M9_9SPHN|nr:hypothetical protein [Tsuneonella dongtanensis]ANY18859.1 hypothetical protein A6F68_00324 [Tsuneonella dongtanensis]